MFRRSMAWLAIATLAAVACDDHDQSCENAREDIELQIDSMCLEATFRDTEFCTKCVRRGYYSIADSCECRVLNFDVDFCLYTPAKLGSPVEAGDGGTVRPEDTVNRAGTPMVRDALIYAADVCRDRHATFPGQQPDAGKRQPVVLDSGPPEAPDATLAPVPTPAPMMSLEGGS